MLGFVTHLVIFRFTDHVPFDVRLSSESYYSMLSHCIPYNTSIVNNILNPIGWYTIINKLRPHTLRHAAPLRH